MDKTYTLRDLNGETLNSYFCIFKVHDMRALFLLISGLLMPLLVAAQTTSDIQYHCVEDQDLQIKRLLENKQAIKDGLAIPREEIYVPLKFHLVADSDGFGRVGLDDVFDQLCALNEEFIDTDLRFYIDDGFNFIDSDQVFSGPDQGIAVAEMIRAVRDVGSESVNIFITERARASSGIENGTVLGFYANANDWMVVRQNQIGNNENTLAHEIGHYFSLMHPHFGWDREPWDANIHGNPVLITRTDGVRVELVDGSNCDESGDFICDTPPDYNFGFGWNQSCPTFNLDVMDRNGDTIRPMQNNFMSYFLGCVDYTFTSEQNELIMADFMSSRRRAIRTGFVPNTAEIENTLELVSPENNTTTEFFDGVELTWTPVENASQYAVVLRSGPDEIIRFVDQPNVFITELKPDEIYTWSVTPFNDGFTCAERKTNILRTNNITTSTEDPAFAETVTVQPNPIRNGENSSIIVESTKSLQATLSIYGLDGKIVLSDKVAIQSGKNQINLRTNEFESGVFILSLSTSEGNITRRLIVSN